MVGRRGPAQAAFTTPELQELGELAGADVIVDPADLEGAEPTDTNSERNLEVLREYAAREPSGKPKRLVLRFFAVAGRDPRRRARRGGRARPQHARRRDRCARSRPTSTRRSPPASSFAASATAASSFPGVPFDERSGTIPNDRGRVAPGVYVAGWIKRGPSGVIGTNKKDATETVELLLEDLRDAPRKGRSAEEVDALLLERGVRLVLYPGLDVDRRARARRRREARPAARQALHLGRAARAPPRACAPSTLES